MSNTNQKILRVKGLKKYFPIRKGFFQRVAGWIKAVDDVDFDIEEGKTLGLVGESGCGKSTVARMILKLLEPDAGEIIFRGQDISRISQKEMKQFRKEIQIVFQDPYGSLNPRMTVGQSIEEGLRTHGLPIGEERRHRLEKLLKMVGMSPDGADRYPHEFSGGQRQRIGIARALSVEPSLVICDEPISALDVSIQAQIINLLKDLQDELRLSYLFISHDLNVVGYLCNTVSVMYRGNILEIAPAEKLYENPTHPYTRALLSAIPDPDPDKVRKAMTIKDDVSAYAVPPSGCSFQERCPHEATECRNEKMPFQKVGIDHYVRCWRVAKDGAALYDS